MGMELLFTARKAKLQNKWKSCVRYKPH